MTQYTATVRSSPKIVSPKSQGEWDDVSDRHGGSKISVLLLIKLLFCSWKTLHAPKGHPCNLTTLSGRPLYRYKEYSNVTYYIQPEPGIGFPGS